MSQPVRGDAARRTATPNAVMTTCASPTQGGSETLSLWTVEMDAGAAGPIHVFHSEQLWTVLSGRLEVTLEEAVFELVDGDSIVLPAGATRQLRAITPTRTAVGGRGDAVVRVVGEEAPRGTPEWIA
jgi:quercetin dioxygenase-like cupin family protein